MNCKKFQFRFMSDIEFFREKKFYLRNLYIRRGTHGMSYAEIRWFFKFWPRVANKIFGGV